MERLRARHMIIALCSVVSACGDSSSDVTGSTGGASTDAGESTSVPTSTSLPPTSTSDATGATTDAATGDTGDMTGSTGQIDPCEMGCLPDTWDLDGDPLTGMCGCEYSCVMMAADDPIDAAYTDDNCDGSDGNMTDCVFVSTSLGSPMGTGTRDDPLDDVAAAIQLAANGGVSAVCLSGEAYAGPVTLAPGVSVLGGFDHTDPEFPFRRGPAAVTSVTAEGTVILAPSIDADTEIAGLTIVATTAVAPGESTYGVRLVAGAATLTVRLNEFEVGAGAVGVSGADGAAPLPPVGGNNGTNGCQGTNCGFGGAAPLCIEVGGAGGDGGFDSGSGSNGSPGTGGATVGNGGGGSACFGGGNNGTAGGSATIGGTPGAGGNAGAALGTIAMGVYVPAPGTDGANGENGGGGSGGGGGGGGDNAGGICNSDRGGGGGSGGCGGLGGVGGMAGGGGGGSFGIFAAAGTIVVTDNVIITDGGGTGGSGGDGNAGQQGGAGGSGGGGNDDSGSGGPGGNGSAGGFGGGGGGGGGGPTACFVHAAAVNQTYVAGTCTLLPPGLGGPGGAGMGAGNSGAPGLIGTAQDVLSVP